MTSPAAARGLNVDALAPPPRARGAGDLAALVLLLVAAALATVWLFQMAGYAPCELCLKERLPYYAALGVSALAFVLARSGARGAARACFALLALLFLCSAGLATYHAGVEWGWWPGPSGCSGPLDGRAASPAEFLHQLQAVRVVRCDAVAIRILGLSLAGWNVVASLAIAALATAGVRRS